MLPVPKLIPFKVETPSVDHLEIIGEVIGTCLGNNKSQVFGQMIKESL